MGQKVNPGGLRLGIVREWDSVWWSEKNLGNWVVEDERIRKIISKKFRNAEVERIKIERTPGFLKIIIRTGKPALLIGQMGREIEYLKKDLLKTVKDSKNSKIDIKIEEVKKAVVSANIIAINLAFQIERNFPYKRAMKKIMGDAIREGVKGIKIKISGRLGGAEMSREEWYSEGRIPTQTLRADLDYATAEALTKYGVIGVKVWLFKGEVLGKKSLFTTTEETASDPDKMRKKKKLVSVEKGRKEEIVLKKSKTRKTEE